MSPMTMMHGVFGSFEQMQRRRNRTAIELFAEA